MRALPRTIFVLGFGLAASSCGELRSRCDSAALEQLAATLELEQPPPATTEAAISGLAQACPNMHPALPLGMSVAYDGGPADQLLQRMDDDFTALSRRLCARPDAWLAAARELPADRRPAARYELCDFGRFDLLEAHERYLGDDYYALLAYQWMLDHGVAAPLARRVTRGLMSATTSMPLLAQRCQGSPEAEGCLRLYTLGGIELPRSTSPALGEGDLTVEVSATQLRFGDAPALTLEQGRLPEGATAHRVIAALWPPLRAAVDAARARSEARSLEWRGGLQIAADRRVPFGTIVALMYTGRRAGVERFELLTDHSGELGVLELIPPAHWYRRLGRQPRSDLLILRGDAQGVHVINGAEPRTLAWDDVEGQTQLASAYVREHPDMPVFELRVVDAVQIDAVVGVLDTLRGSDCSAISTLDDPSARDCKLYQPIVSPLPPITGRDVDWSELQLELLPGEREVKWPKSAGSRRSKGPRGPVDKREVRARIEAALPELRSCLAESDAARVAAPEFLGLGFGEAGPGELSLRVFSDPEFSLACIHELLDAQPASGERFLSTYYLDLTVTITAPPLTGPGFDE